jgi:hypothetical protein
VLDETFVIITDPPYGQGWRAPAPRKTASPGLNGGWVPAKAGRSCPDSIAGDDAPFDPSLVLALGLPTLLWGAHKVADRLPAGRWLVWDKRVDLPSNSYGDAEMAWCNVDGPTRLFRHRWSGLVMESGSDEARRKPGTSEAQGRLHPNQKPLALMRWCIELMPPGTVLDPYAGVGSTLRAAKDLGRAAIGIEIDERYCEIAANRVRQGVLPFRP